MAHGKSLQLAQIRPVVIRYMTPDQYGQHLKATGKVPGYPPYRPAGAVPRPRRERRANPAADPYTYPKGRRRPRAWPARRVRLGAGDTVEFQPGRTALTADGARKLVAAAE